MKSISPLLALFALAGILNCALIEPAFAYKDEAAHSESSEEDSDCCFIHCSMHYQWLAANSSALFHDAAPFTDYIPVSSTFRVDSPLEPIFHPPLTR
jgi:hypothetical protein